MRAHKLINIIFFLVVTGIGGIIAQTVLLREMLILFSGNELSIGVIIGSWVLWEAGGAFFGGRWRLRHESAIKILVLSTLVFSCLFPFSIYITRIFKIVAGIPPDTGVGILPIFYASFFIVFPVGFLHGFLFTVMCSVYNEMIGENQSAVGMVYFYEMVGTIIGGVLLNYFLIQSFNSFVIAVLLSLLSAISCILLIVFYSRLKKYLLFFCISLVLLASLILLSGKGTERLHLLSVKEQWKGRDVVHYENSPYQNIVVVKNEEQYTFFSDGLPVVTTPTPDIVFIEEFVHFSMLSHNMPVDILILNGGAGGVINEILKYPTVKRIDYIETDPVFLKTIQSFSTPLTDRELKNPLVKLQFIDGRVFIKKPPVRYDVIFLGLPLPYTLQTNRFFTKEFFIMAKNALKDGGIISLALPGNLTYYSRELKDIHLCIMKTLESVFEYRYIIPGDVNIFIYSDSSAVSGSSYKEIYRRSVAYGVKAGLVSQQHLSYRLDTRWLEWYLSNFKNKSAEVNRDFSPYAFFYTIAYHNMLFSPYLKTFFDLIRGISFLKIIIFLSFVFFIFYLLGKKYERSSLAYVIGTSGFTAMVLELILIFSFQIFYGYVFFEIGILVTVFLCGLAFGAIAVTSEYSRRFKDINMLRLAELFIIALAVSIYLIFRLGGSVIHAEQVIVRIFFFLALFVSGFLTGAEFPLTNRIYNGNSDSPANIGKTVGVLYSIDLIGGWIGGLLGGIILSMIGILEGCLVLAFIKAGSLLLLLTYNKKVVLFS